MPYSSIFFKKIHPKVAELEGKATGLLSAAEKYDLRVRQLELYLEQLPNFCEGT